MTSGAAMHVLAITPGEGLHPERWRRVLRSGIDALLIREPGLDREALRQAAAWCVHEAPQVKLWLRGLTLEGCGLHLPEGPESARSALSRPLHSEEQWPVRSHHEQLLISPIFPTPGKAEAWGLPRLHRFLDEVPEEGPRLLALGGVTPENAEALRHPRLSGIAAIRPFWQGDPERMVEAFRRAWD
jgi:thiamine monophosphate synthase